MHDLGLDHVRPWVNRGPLRMRRGGQERGARHRQRVEDLVLQHVRPRPAAKLLDHRAQQPKAGVRVMEPMPGRVLEPGIHDVRQLRPDLARRPLPPRSRRLAGQPGGVGQELRNGHPADRCIGQVVFQPVVEPQPPLVAQPHDEDGDEGLAQ